MHSPGPFCASATAFANRFERDGPNSTVSRRSIGVTLIDRGLVVEGSAGDDLDGDDRRDRPIDDKTERRPPDVSASGVEASGQVTLGAICCWATTKSACKWE